MTTVANQSVGPDSISGTVKGGTKSSGCDCACFLGAGIGPNKVAQVSAGTLGGTLGPGTGLPKMSAGTLGGVDKKFADKL